MSQAAEFTLIFDGPSVVDGKIDARELAPALIATADLIEAVNEAAFNDKTKVQIKVKAHFICAFPSRQQIQVKL